MRFTDALICAVTVWVGTSGEPVRAANSAEQLGFGPDARLLIIHADDVGMCHSVNVATIEALQRGIVTSASIMVPCPWFPAIAAYARENSDRDLGLHLTLTSEWKYYRWRPVAPSTETPGLLDEKGYLWRSEADTAAHASAKEVEIELRAQIERALAFGIRPTHLDTHMGALYTRQDFFAVYKKLSQEYRIPMMVMRPSPELEAYAKANASPISTDILRATETDGFAMLDYLVTGVPGRRFEDRKRAYFDLLQQLKPGVSMLIVHLGLDTPELRAITGSWEQRHADFRVFTDPETRRWIDDRGIRLTTWRELGTLAWRNPPAAGKAE